MVPKKEKQRDFKFLLRGNYMPFKPFIIITIALIILCSSYLFMKIFFIPYEKNYFIKAGVIRSHMYDDIIKSKGLPVKEEVVEEGRNYTTKSVYYDGYKLNFLKRKSDPKPEYMLQNIVITDPKYKLGFFKIGIGSSKSMVKFAYVGAKKIVEYENAYLDGLTGVQFHYDEKNKVKKIEIFDSP